MNSRTAPERSVDALVCDMDGTLLDSSTVVPDTFIEVVDEIDGRTFDRDEVVALYSLGEPARMLTHMLERPATEDDVQLYHGRLAANASRSTSVRSYPGIADTLDQLTGHLRLAVFTGASHQAAEILLGATNLSRFFEVVIGGDQVPHPKPHPAGIIAACTSLGVAPEAAAYVGDAPTDLEAARRSGAIALAAGWGHLFDPSSSADDVIAAPLDLVGLLS